MKPSLFSVSFAGLWGQARLALPEFIARAARLGFPSVMLMGKRPHLSPLDANPEFVHALKAALKKNRVRCDVVAAYTHLAPGIAPEVPWLEFQIAYVESLARLAAALGGSVLRIFTAYESGGRETDAHWSRAAGVIREMCDRAAAHRVTIAIQNHHDLAVHTDAMLEFLAEIDRPNCKLGFDAWSPAFRGEDLYEAARKAAPHTAITTNADYVRFPRFQYLPELTNYQRLIPDLARAVPFGTGSIDYAAFFEGLRDGGFSGLAVYEMCSPLRGGGTLQNLEACARTYLKWMRAQQLLD